MPTGAISDGEANDIRARLRAVEDDAILAQSAADKAAHANALHEAVCAARYRNIILLILGLAAANSVAALPHLAAILAFLK